MSIDRRSTLFWAPVAAVALAALTGTVIAQAQGTQAEPMVGYGPSSSLPQPDKQLIPTVHTASGQEPS